MELFRRPPKGNCGDASPIIITGMHRSGTSVLTRALSELGLFVGQDLDQNNESLFFQKVNKLFFSIAGGRWDNPKPVIYLCRRDEYLDLTKEYIKYILSSPRIYRYSGVFKLLAEGNPVSWRRAWGWKDPRNTISLPIWKELFPKAKVIHIRRHGVDVSASLKNRSRNMFNTGLKKVKRKLNYLYPFYWMRLKHSGFGGSVRVRSFSDAFSLWYYYIRSAHRYSQEYDRFIDVKFEDLVSDSERQLNRLGEFCNLEFTSADIEEAANMFDSSRSFAYRTEAFTEELSSEMVDQLEYAGYSF